jgi:sigma-B regulation protein RsbU (phosphoserine phosphatase)
MLMIQSGVAGLVRAQPDAAPSRILHLLNGVIFDNVRHRLVGDEHVTLSLLRYEGDGRFRFAGAHEEMVVWRAASGRCERIATPGTWVGAIADIGGATIDSELSLEPGDVLLLYTDGVTEAMSEASEQFGIERVTEVVAAAAGKSATAVVESVLERAVAWQAQQDDDMTVVAIRRVG